MLGESVVLHDNMGQRVIFINALVNKDESSGGSGGGGGGGKDSSKGKSSFFNSEIMTYLLFPASLGVVYYWQVYVKGNPLFTSSDDSKSGPT